MTNSPDERGAELRELFFETSQELLQALNEEALKLEKKPGDEEIVRGIRRTVHTLKGDSAACGLRELSELAHQFEDALSIEGTATQAAVAEIAFAAADVFTEMIAAYRSGTKAALHQESEQEDSGPDRRPGRKDPADEEVARARRPTAKTAAARSLPRQRRCWTEYEKLAMAKAQASGLAVYHVVVKIDPHCAMPIAGRQLIHNALGGCGAGDCGASRCEVAGRVEAGRVRAGQRADGGADFGQGTDSDHRRGSDGRVDARAQPGSAAPAARRADAAAQKPPRARLCRKRESSG